MANLCISIILLAYVAFHEHKKYKSILHLLELKILSKRTGREKINDDDDYMFVHERIKLKTAIRTLRHHTIKSPRERKVDEEWRIW